MGPLYLGIDGGGSHTRALVANAAGHLVGEGRAGPSNPNDVGIDACVNALITASTRAVSALEPQRSDFRVICAGVAGLTAAELQAHVRDAFNADTRIRGAKLLLASDLECSHAAAFSGSAGCLLIAGTGSACLGVSERGEAHRCGGWGELADDAGSASWIGTRALQAAVRQGDGRLTGTQPLRLVLDYFGVDQLGALSVRITPQNLTRQQRGELAPLVVGLYGKGSQAIDAIVDAAAEALCELVATTVRMLDLRNPPVVVHGGLGSAPIIHSLLKQKLSECVQGMQWRTALYPPGNGALLRALQADGLRLAPAS